MKTSMVLMDIAIAGAAVASGNPRGRCRILPSGGRELALQCAVVCDWGGEGGGAQRVVPSPLWSGILSGCAVQDVRYTMPSPVFCVVACMVLCVVACVV